MIKVAFIGAGSIEFTRNVVTDLCSFPELSGDVHFALHDISPDRLSFAQALMRQAFAGGRDPGELDTVLLAGAAAEIHPAAMIKAMELRGTRDRLAAAHTQARADGVTAVPAVAWRGEVFAGPDALERAAAAMSGARA